MQTGFHAPTTVSLSQTDGAAVRSATANTAQDLPNTSVEPSSTAAVQPDDGSIPTTNAARVAEAQQELQAGKQKQNSTAPCVPESRPETSPSPRQGSKGSIRAEEAADAGPSGRGAAEEGVGVAAGRRNVSIKAKDWAGNVVWAKLAKYPWWPAQVLDESDPWIPSDAEPPRRGAIPVRFFGTYDFAWIESQRAICPYDHNYDEHSSKSKQKSFLDALSEANNFRDTQELPDGFNEDGSPSPQKGPRKGKVGAGKGKGKRDALWMSSGKPGKRGAEDTSFTRHRSVRERQDSIMSTLSLAPPPDSPYAHSLCLDGVRKLLELQAAGQYPPPQPVVQPPQQHPYLQQQIASHLPFMQQLPGQSRPPWPMQSYMPPATMNFFTQPGGVQGALLAAAGQHVYPPKQL